MLQVKDTVLEHGVLFWPVHPPKTSMLVVVKATYELGASGTAQLAATQDLATGEQHWDDDPERSVRYPTDYALLKPRGECFVVGSCRSHTAQPVEQTVAALGVGPVEKAMAVYGDRRWEGTNISPAQPFTEMPLCWERAFGGAGFDANPIGRGLRADADGHVWLPNLESASSPLASVEERPKPTGAFPIPMTWPARTRLAGTYDEEWRKTRFPWLAADLRFAFFNEAPSDQQIKGYWRGDERIRLRNLHPEHPRVDVKLPFRVARAFVERTGGSFEEVALALDTITVDADRGVALCVWRGTVELGHSQLNADGIDKLFVMDEPAMKRSPVERCQRRMNAKIDARAARIASLSGVAPPPLDAAAGMGGATEKDGKKPDAMVLQTALDELDGVAPAEAPDSLAGLREELSGLGIDLDEVIDPTAADKAMEAAGPPDLEKMREAFQSMGYELPEGMEELLEKIDNREPPPPPTPKPEKQDPRAIVIETHKRGAPLRGDFSGVNLSGLELAGLDARGAIFLETSFRGSDLSRARLDDATMVKADLLSANLEGASLTKTDLSDAVLEDTKLGGANLDGATLERAEMKEAVLVGASLKKADLTEADLEKADLSGAVCDEAVFNFATLTSATCKRTRFVDSRLHGVKGQELMLDGADLTRVRVCFGADLSGSSVRGAKADASHWRDANLERASFAGTSLVGADFSRARMTSVQLASCPLRGARFREAELVGASLRDADVFKGSFRSANLNGADMRGANLYTADFFFAHGEGVDLEGADVGGTAWERK